MIALQGKSQSQVQLISAQLSVLLVEDNPIICRVHTEFLKHLGCRVDLATNSQEALATMSRNEYRIIFLDAGLPEINGFELAKIIRNSEKPDEHQILILLSAYPYDQIKEQSEQAGIDEFAIKPVSMETLRLMLQRWLPLSAGNPS